MSYGFPPGVCRIVIEYIYDDHTHAIAQLRQWRARPIIVDQYDVPQELPSYIRSKTFRDILPRARWVDWFYPDYHEGKFCHPDHSKEKFYHPEGKRIRKPADAHTDKLADKCTDASADKCTDSVIFEYIDRGVPNWKVFGEYVAEKYPSARALVVQQNYTHGSNSDAKDAEHFIEFVRSSELRLFILIDSQSSFFDAVKPWKLLQAQPADSHYIILTNSDSPVLPKILGAYSRLYTDKKRNATLQICIMGPCVFEHAV